MISINQVDFVISQIRIYDIKNADFIVKRRLIVFKLHEPGTALRHNNNGTTLVSFTGSESVRRRAFER